MLAREKGGERRWSPSNGESAVVDAGSDLSRKSDILQFLDVSKGWPAEPACDVPFHL